MKLLVFHVGTKSQAFLKRFQYFKIIILSRFHAKKMKKKINSCPKLTTTVHTEVLCILCTVHTQHKIYGKIRRSTDPRQNFAHIIESVKEWPDNLNDSIHCATSMTFVLINFLVHHHFIIVAVINVGSILIKRMDKINVKISSNAWMEGLFVVE
jgi:hypothetical protein